MAGFQVYSPDQVIVTFGSIIIRGYANDTFVEVERDEDGFTKYTGALGDVARSKNLNLGGSLTITLMAVSPTNDDLHALALLDELDGDAYATLQVTDLSGNMFCNAEIAWIKKMPKIERAKESGTVQWVFDCAAIDVRAGGNVLTIGVGI